MGWDEVKFQEMRSGTIVNPTEKEMTEAVRPAEESNEPGARGGMVVFFNLLIVFLIARLIFACLLRFKGGGNHSTLNK